MFKSETLLLYVLCFVTTLIATFVVALTTGNEIATLGIGLLITIIFITCESNNRQIKTTDGLQRQIDELKHELEEAKRKINEPRM